MHNLVPKAQPQLGRSKAYPAFGSSLPDSNPRKANESLARTSVLGMESSEGRNSLLAASSIHGNGDLECTSEKGTVMTVSAELPPSRRASKW